jgi:formylglycine-generating enzyme required for sulfatase activity
MATHASPTRHLISARCGILGICGPVPPSAKSFSSRALRATLGGARALVLRLVLALILALLLRPIHAASPAHAADDVATAPDAPPSVTWPLRSLTLAEERSLQPARRFKECATCPEMVVIPAGQFRMGSVRGDGDRDEEGPNGQPFTVSIATPYALGRYVVTVGDYLECAAEAACPPTAWQDPQSPYHATAGSDDHYKRLGTALTDPRHPIVGVTWKNAQSYVTWLNGKLGLASAHGYRLPSEAEWERGARGGIENLKYFWGDRFTANSANGTGQSGADRWPYTSPVGSFPANPYGLYDVAGNVWQWVQDCYHPTYADMPEAVVNTGVAWESTCDDRGRRVLRGGSWIDLPRVLRVADRGGSPPDMHYGYVGFRLARTLAH